MFRTCGTGLKNPDARREEGDQLTSTPKVTRAPAPLGSRKATPSRHAPGALNLAPLLTKCPVESCCTPTACCGPAGGFSATTSSVTGRARPAASTTVMCTSDGPTRGEVTDISTTPCDEMP